MPKREKNALLNFSVYIASVFSRGKGTEARLLSLSLSLENNTHSEKRSLFRTHSQKQNEQEQTAAAAEEQVAEKEEEEQVEEASSEDIVIKTTPFDPRFPQQNQAKHCYTRYNEYHKCAAEKGEEECASMAKLYRSICPGEWVEKWNEERENGTWPGRY
jgi:cytochrome c oxidase subunit 6b